MSRFVHSAVDRKWLGCGTANWRCGKPGYNEWHLIHAMSYNKLSSKCSIHQLLLSLASVPYKIWCGAKLTRAATTCRSTTMPLRCQGTPTSQPTLTWSMWYLLQPRRLTYPAGLMATRSPCQRCLVAISEQTQSTLVPQESISSVPRQVLQLERGWRAGAHVCIMADSTLPQHRQMCSCPWHSTRQSTGSPQAPYRL